MFETMLRFPLGLVFLVLEDKSELPDIAGRRNLWRSPGVIAHTVLHDSECAVHLSAGDGRADGAPLLLFGDNVTSTRRRLEIWDVYLKRIASIPLADDRVRLMMWGNHPRQSGRIHIQLPG